MTGFAPRWSSASPGSRSRRCWSRPASTGLYFRKMCRSGARSVRRNDRKRKKRPGMFFTSPGPGLEDTSMHCLFQRRDPGDHGLGETIDARPGAVTDAMLVRRDVDDGAASLRLGHPVVALLVGKDDQAIALAVDLADGLAE